MSGRHWWLLDYFGFGRFGFVCGFGEKLEVLFLLGLEAIKERLLLVLAWCNILRHHKGVRLGLSIWLGVILSIGLTTLLFKLI